MNKEAEKSKVVVIKIGTSVLTGGTLALNKAHMIELVRQCAKLKEQGHALVIVSSGAIVAGKEHLGYPKLPNSMVSKQLLAAVGQSQLMQTWESLFAIYDLKVGQMLLTRADMEDRERFLNARDTIMALLKNDIIPVVNENDAVATHEIKIGDNDNLSALVSILCHADQLLLLTDQKGLFTLNPRKNSHAKLIKEVVMVNDEIRKIASDTKEAGMLGTGGMATKVQAAEVACRTGVEVVIALGSAPNIIWDILYAKPESTRFLPYVDALVNRKSWILAGPIATSYIVIDSGALQALVDKNRSLLAKGIVSVKGVFSRGDVVAIWNNTNQLIAKGISHYSSVDLHKILGKHSRDIERLLGYSYGDEVIHRDDMVII